MTDTTAFGPGAPLLELGHTDRQVELSLSPFLAIAGDRFEQHERVAVHVGLAVEHRLQEFPEHPPHAGDERADDWLRRVQHGGVRQGRPAPQRLEILEQRPDIGHWGQRMPAPEISVQLKHDLRELSGILRVEVGRHGQG